MPKVHFKNLALIDYKAAWGYQEKLFNEAIESKLVAASTKNYPQ